MQFFKPNAQLEIEVLQEKFLLHPLIGTPSKDPLIHGTLTVRLKNASRIQSLSVRLLGLYDLLYSPKDGEHAQTLSVHNAVSVDRNVALETTSERLPAGQSTFAFALAVPSATACQQRTTYGRIRHKLIAEARIEDKTVTAEHLVQIIASPVGLCALPPPLLIETVDAVEMIGPFRMLISSPYCTVGAPLTTALTLESVPAALEILRVTLNIHQHFELVHGNQSVTPPMQPWRVFIVDKANPASNDIGDRPPRTTTAKKPLTGAEEALAEIAEGGSWSFRHATRLPDDDAVRYTTSVASETPIKVWHEFQLDVAIRQRDRPEIKHLLVTKPVEIATCCCLLADVMLPQYSKEPQPLKRPLRRCICGSTMKDLIDESGRAIYNSHGDDMTMGVICKTMAYS